MKILLISSFLPYPLHSGGQVRLYNLLKQLQKKHPITLICEIRANQTQEDIAQVEKICEKVITIVRKKQWSIRNIAKTGISLDPFLLVGHNLPEMKQVIQDELVKTRYDLIHVETFYVAQNVPETTLPIILVEHNIEYMVYQRFAQKALLPLRPAMLIDVMKMRRKEEAAWRNAHTVVAVSGDEEKIIHKINSRTAVVANGVDLMKFKIQNSKFKIGERKTILFIGDFKWIQNQDAVMWILDFVFPRIQADNPEMNVSLWIVGRNMPDALKKRANEFIYMDDNSSLPTEEIFHRADILLAPIRVGGGTSYKIIEAMASGTPVVTTTLGNEGINAMHKKEIMIADTPEAISEAVKGLITNQKLYETMGKNARTVVEKRFSWEKIGKDLEEVYESVV